jgi:hypothetical protein
MVGLYRRSKLLMFLYSQSLRSKKNTPYSVNWTSTTADGAEGEVLATTNTQTLSGIGVPIVIKLQFSTASGATGTMSYSLNGASLIIFSNNDTLTVSNGSSLYFTRRTDAQAGSTTVLTIINVSNNNLTLDTVNMNAFL